MYSSLRSIMEFVTRSDYALAGYRSARFVLPMKRAALNSSAWKRSSHAARAVEEGHVCCHLAAEVTKPCFIHIYIYTHALSSWTLNVLE